MRDHPCVRRKTSSLALLGVLPVLLELACAGSAEDHLRAARDALFCSDARAAVKEYEQAIQLARADPSLQSRRLLISALREAADAYHLELRDPLRAVQLYRDLVSAGPAGSAAARAHVKVSEILRNDLRDVHGAIGELAEAMVADPSQSTQLRYLSAKLYFELGDYPRCVAECDSVRAEDPASPLAGRATLLKVDALSMIDGRSSEGIRDLEMLAERFPGSELEAQALYELGRMRANAGDLEAAIEQWVRALKMHPAPSLVQSTILRARKRWEQVSGATGKARSTLLAKAMLDGVSGLRRARRGERP
jgi:tetratricopeptide (TPR) repeat protein